MANPNLYGPHSQGVIEAAVQMRQLSNEQWATVLAEFSRWKADPDLWAFMQEAVRMSRTGPIVPTYATIEFQRHYFANSEFTRRAREIRQLKGAGITESTSIALCAVANREQLSAEQFEVATLGYNLVGINCEELATLGEVDAATARAAASDGKAPWEYSSSRPNWFGPNSRGVVEAAEQIRNLTAEQWVTVLTELARQRSDPLLNILKYEALAQVERPATRHMELYRMLTELVVGDPRIRSRISSLNDPAGLTDMSLSVRTTLGALASGEKLTERLFAIATAGYDLVGIDCEALAKLGRFSSKARKG